MIGRIIYDDLNTEGRLPCDGRLVNDVDYPELAPLLTEVRSPDLMANQIAPNVPLIAGDPFSITVNDSYIAIGGSFNTTNAARLAIADKETRALETWTPTFSSEIQAVKYNGTELYVGGLFTTVTENGGSAVTRRYFAAFENNGKILLSGTPNFNSYVRGIATDDDYVYVCGDFTGTYQNKFSMMDKNTFSFVTNVQSFNNGAYAIAVDDTYIYVGGDFTGTYENRFSIMYKSTRAHTTKAPTFNSTVRAIAVDDDYVYVGGSFTTVTIPGYSAAQAKRFAILRKSDWSLVHDAPGFNGEVWAIDQDDEYIYIGGSFTGEHRQRNAVIRKSDFSIVDGVTESNNMVRAIVSDGDLLYMAGYFTGTDSYKFKTVSKHSTPPAGKKYLPTIPPKVVLGKQIPTQIQVSEV